MEKKNRTEFLFNILPQKLDNCEPEFMISIELTKHKDTDTHTCNICKREYTRNIFYINSVNNYYKCLNCLFKNNSVCQDSDVVVTQFRYKIVTFIKSSENGSFTELQGKNTCGLCKVKDSFLFLKYNNSEVICLACYANSFDTPIDVKPLSYIPKEINIKDTHTTNVDHPDFNLDHPHKLTRTYYEKFEDKKCSSRIYLIITKKPKEVIFGMNVKILSVIMFSV